jgi:hypothetical protein
VPLAYSGVYKRSIPASPPLHVNDLQPDFTKGGWGSFTTGMLAVEGGDKSFGVFGQGKTQTSTIKVPPLQTQLCLEASRGISERWILATAPPSTWRLQYCRNLQITKVKAQIKSSLNSERMPGATTPSTLQPLHPLRIVSMMKFKKKR